VAGRKPISREAARIGRRVLEARKAARLSQEELAHRAGVRVQTILRYERGYVTQTIRTLEKIGRATSRPLSFFITPPPEPTDRDQMTMRHLEQMSSGLERLMTNLEQLAERQARQLEQLAQLVERQGDQLARIAELLEPRNGR
jgi:transcriptional regulator with XRE-family HTH domain